MMKFFLFTGLFCAFFTIRAFSQTNGVPINPRDSAKTTGTAAAKGFTGKMEDVLNNYLQVAAKNLTSSTSNAQLTLNWFALNTTDSATKYRDVNFIHTAWERNGEFIFVGGIAKTNVFNSFQAGVNYNLLSRRDTAFHYYDKVYTAPFIEENKIILATVDKFSSPVAAGLNEKLVTIISRLYRKGEAVSDLQSIITNNFKGYVPSPYALKIIGFLQKQYNKAIQKPREDRLKTDSVLFWCGQAATTITRESLGIPLNTYVKSLGKQPLKVDAWIDSSMNTTISKYIDSQVAADTALKSLKAKTLTDLNKTVIKNYEDLVKYVSQQPLLTFGYNYTYGTGTVLSSHEAGFQYMQGLTALGSVNTAGLTGSVTDTLTGTDPTGKERNFGRDILAIQGGFNKILLVQKKVSTMEVNLAAEEDLALEGYTKGTDKSNFTLDAYYRVRLPGTPWLKLSIKYDPKAANVFGFFDFTYNIDNSK